MERGKKIAIGAGIAAAISGVVYAVTRGKKAPPEPPPTIMGEIGPGLIYYKEIGAWEEITPGREIAFDSDITIAPIWINYSSFPIVGTVELSIKFPDGTISKLIAVKNQNKEAAPGDGYYVQFEPFHTTQDGVYIFTSTLLCKGVKLGEMIIALVAKPMPVPPSTVLLILTNPPIEGTYWQFYAINADKNDYRAITEIPMDGAATLSDIADWDFPLSIALSVYQRIDAETSRQIYIIQSAFGPGVDGYRADAIIPSYGMYHFDFRTQSIQSVGASIGAKLRG